ncbi:MAG: enoyl-CoA hydratase/isomerase family protein, partial [Acidimicrobiales bacterium]
MPAEPAGEAGAADAEVLAGRSCGGRVARITINRPQVRNAMSWAVVRGLRAAFAEAKADPEVRVVVLSGAGDKAFCSGADLGGMAGGDEGFLPVHDARG